MNITVTGHRPKDLGNEYNLRGTYCDYIATEAQKVIDEFHPEFFYNGLAEGVDQLLALLAIANDIKVYGCIPFEGQENMWSDESKERYHMILNHSLTTVINVSGKKIDRATPYWQIAAWMQQRNEFMVDKLVVENGNRLMPVWNGNTIKSGTYNCLKYAQKRIPESQISYIDPRKALL